MSEELEKENNIGKVEPIDITSEMQESYLDYAMSVIVSRALPDVRDGLKPVHRRILYAMWQMGLKSGGKFRKSATVVGEVLGKYHPHGDMAVYDSMVRMAQDFSLRYPLVHGQGNFGCFTKDTKVKLVDGRSLSFGELIKETKKGKENFTYTFNNKTKRVEIAEIKEPRLTKKQTGLVQVTLDSGEKIRCTPNHRFMLRDGSYKEAQNLCKNESLMPHKDNHKVVSVKKLKKREDVYDLTIDETHNFLLDAGVFVHNSIDGDSAAAHRYTEAKMSGIAEELLYDIERETIDFAPNYDATQKEPRVMPAKIPNLLLNGSMGIAVGMATNIPPHNLTEICDAVIHLIDNPDCTIDDLMEFVKGPDFPTGGIIFDKNAIKQAYATGRGGIVMQAKTDIIEEKGKFKIIVKEIPYQVNKSTLIEKIADLVQNKKIEGIRDLRDESSKEGIRIVIELKKDAYPKKVLNRLFVLTSLQDTFHVNTLALVDNGTQPKILTLKNILEEYLKHRLEVVRRRGEYDLARAKERAHILEGLKIAILKIDRIIATIKKSKDKDEARVNLIQKFKLTEIQSVAILEMRLQQLANMERLRVEQELKEKKALIKELEALLASKKEMQKIIKNEVKEIKEKYGDERRTKVVAHGVKEFKPEDLVPNEPTIIMITRDGYIKRIPPDTFKIQGRGGKGVMGLTTKEEDIVNELFTTMTHNDLFFFTSRGRVFQLKTYDVPPASRTAKGQALVNFLQLGSNEKVSAVLSYDDISEQKYLVMATKKGSIKKVDKEEFANVRRSGLIAIGLHDDDYLEWVKPSSGNDDIIIVTANGQAIKFQEKGVRAMGRTAAGVHAIRLKKDDYVVGMDVVDTKLIGKNMLELVVIMENGHGKKTTLKSYKTQGRGGSGIKTAKITDKTGKIIRGFITNIEDDRDMVIISTKGQVIRMSFKSVPSLGRATQGVRLMRFKDIKDRVASVTLI
ncbi:DNA gyrase subunit A [Patescibacteria group bacterium]|nr:DNA gyrase subunit A [Patescibacteria group bacterium]